MLPFDYRAELRAIAGLLGVQTAPNWPQRLATFEPWLAGYLEYQIKPGEPALSVVTLGKERAFLDRVSAQLRHAGASAPVHDAFRALQERVRRATWGLKLSVADPADVQIYVKKPLPLSAILGWLSARGLSPDTLGLLEQAAADLEKTHTHFVGLDATQEQDLPLQIYFTQYSDDVDQIQERVLQVAARVGVTREAGDQIAAAFQHLARPRRTIWLSLTVVGRQLQPTLKLDFSSPPAAEVLRLFTPSQQATLQRLAREVRTGTPDYVGLRFTNQVPPQPALYVTRHSRVYPRPPVTE